MARTRTQYAVVWKRRDCAPRRKTFYSRPAVERLLTLLGPEPWKAYTDKDPDDLQCCRGTVHDECGCGGLTVREASDLQRRDMPPIEYVRVHQRRVTTTEWQEERR